TAQGIAQGERIDRALLDAGKQQVAMYRAALPLAQLGISFIPGLGHGVNAAIGAGLALAEGKRITEAMIEAVKNAVPGGPLAKAALDVGLRGAVDLASGKSLDMVALDAARRNLPGGDAAKVAFDAGLALAQGKKIQDAGLAAVGRFVPKDALAQGAFEMTKRVMAGKPTQGSTNAAMKALVARSMPRPRPPPPKHVRTPLRPPVPVHGTAFRSPPMRAETAHALLEQAVEPEEETSSAMPIV